MIVPGSERSIPSARLRAPTPRPPSGFLLLEALVALALIGVALLLSVALLTSEARFREARDGRSRVLGAQEDVLELVRSGYLDLTPATLEREELEALLERPLPPMTVWVEVEPSGIPGLYDVSVTTRYVVGRRLGTDRLPTRIRGP